MSNSRHSPLDAMTKPVKNTGKIGQLKGVALALAAVLSVVAGAAVGMYIPQVQKTYTTETSTLHTTETESHTFYTTKSLLATETNTRTNTITTTETLMTTIATTIITTKTMPPVDIVWEKTHGRSEYDRAESIVDSGDGQFMVAGRTSSFGAGGLDAYLLKIDGNGNKVWEKTCGGSGDDVANCIVQSGDGGYVVAGWTTSFGAGLRDVYLLKIDSSGNKIWEKAYGGHSGDGAFSIVESGNGEFIAAGITTSFGAGNASAYLLKIDSDGNKVWEKTYGGNKDDVANWIIRSGDDGFIVTGWTDSFGAGGLDFYLLKIDGDGSKVWEKAYGGSDDDEAIGIVESGDGGFIVAGYTTSEFEDVCLLKIDADGNKVWEKTYGGNDDDWAYRIVQSGEGGFIITGVTYSFGAGYMDMYLLKIDGDGNKIWETAIGGSEDDEPWEIIETGDGTFMVAGYTMSFGAGDADVYLLKIRDNT